MDHQDQQFEPVPGISGTQRTTSTSSSTSRTVKAWNAQKTKGKVITIKSFDDLVVKVRKKFEVPDEEVMCIVCEDGCEIEDDDGLWGIFGTHHIPAVYFLVGNDKLSMSSESGAQSSYQFLMENLKRKRGINSESRQKKECLTVKIAIGWMHYNSNEKRYVTVRSQKGGGTRREEVLRAATYDQILEKLTTHFFPAGKSPMGRLTRFSEAIGDSRGNFILKENFNIETIIKESKKEIRLYLMTRERTFLLESDSDSDFELPQIQFKNVRTPSQTNQMVTQPIVSQLHTFSPQLVQQEQQNMSVMSMSQTPPGHVGTGTPTVTFNQDSLKCCICYERERKAFLIPCGHQFCMVCALHLEANNIACPLCRGAISSVGKLQDS